MQPNMPLAELLDTVRRNAALPRSQAEATPPQVYSSPEFLELERDLIFNKEWICVGRRDEFARAGDYRVVTISRDQVIVIRGHDGALRAMSNICRHRMASLLEGEGNLSGKITCRYHAWSYTFDGQLAGAAHMPDDFDKRECGLPQFAVEDWLGWIYVNLDADAEPLAPRMKALADRFANHDLASYRTLFRVEEVWQTNWKILFQNFTEGYHLFAVHPTTVDHVLPTSRAEVQEGGPGYCLFTQARLPGVAYESGEAMQNPNPALTEDQINSVPIFGAYPSHVASVSADRMFWMSLMPVNVGEVRVFWGVDVHPDAMTQVSDRAAWIDTLRCTFEAINREDKQIIETIARNAAALAAEPGRLSPKEATIWDFQNYIARMIAQSVNSRHG